MPEAPAATAVIPPHDAPYDPAGEDWVVTGCVDGCIRLWHVPSRTLLRAMSGHRDVVWSAAEAEVKPQPKHIMPSIWAAAMQDAADDAVEEGIRKQLTSSTAADKLDSTGLNLKSAWCAFTMATPPLEAMDFIKLKIRPPGKPEFVLDPDRSIDLKVYFFGDGDDGQTTTVALPSLEPLNRAFEGGLTAHYRDAAELALGLTAVRKGYISMNSGEVTAISSTPPPTPLPLVTDAAAAASEKRSGRLTTTGGQFCRKLNAFVEGWEASGWAPRHSIIAAYVPDALTSHGMDTCAMDITPGRLCVDRGVDTVQRRICTHGRTAARPRFPYSQP
eukprot:XP_001696268.1 predicted protein [Chlamydomonas reinhardtii]